MATKDDRGPATDHRHQGATEGGAAAPESTGAAVRVDLSPLVLPTVMPAPPDRYPAYLGNRVYQGSSGTVYPLPFHERIDPDVHDHAFEAVTLENDYVRVVVLPALGGRIHCATDLTRDYDFIYRNHVMKPALVGLTGPWVSGGIEFNWPQHHRPGTYLPMECTVEREPDGSVTAWCSDHDPFDRMKGMHGVRLRPGSALIELRVRLFNRTDDARTFLWWANAAAHAHDRYQSFFPSDVTYVADHAKRAITSFPVADRPYYGWDYPQAARDEERGPAEPSADRIDFYRNIPVPTSYMGVGSEEDFVGGYDHEVGAGFVHVADHRIAPGKKMWTWGNAPFGWAWDSNLTDDDGPYVEIMAGVFTDNQPDFSHLAPGETKSFSQYWYPLQDIGPAHQATTEAAVRLDLGGQPARDDATGIGPRTAGAARLAVATTRPRSALTARLCGPDGALIAELTQDVAPGAPLVGVVDVPPTLLPHQLTLTVLHEGEELLHWTPPQPDRLPSEPGIATEPAAPTEIRSTDELYLTGRHLEQYRHATRRPEPYWEEALRRDPEDSRSRTALGVAHLRRGELALAEEHLRAAIARMTLRNPNPETGEAHYQLGRTLERQGRDHEALEAHGKASWVEGWRAAADLAAARILARRGTAHDDRQALDLVRGTWSERDPRNQARTLTAILLRRRGEHQEAERLLHELLRVDPLDAWARDLATAPASGEQHDAQGSGASPPDGPTLLDVALEYASVGETSRAITLLERAATAPLAPGQVSVAPLADLHRAELLELSGDLEAAAAARAAAHARDARWCFPSRPADLDLLTRTVQEHPEDHLAHRLLGHQLYHLGRRTEALASWRSAVALQDEDPVTRRNLAVGSFDVEGDAGAALDHYERARALAPADSRLLYEQDVLRRRAAVPVPARLAALEAEPDLVAQRDDLTITLARLLTATGRSAEAVRQLESRDFQPWEGGEGIVLEAWEEAHLALAREALGAGDAARAEELLRSALNPIASLGETRHPLAATTHLDRALGEALSDEGREEEARSSWRRAADSVGDFRSMAAVPYSDLTYHAVHAARHLGDTARAQQLTDGLQEYADALEDSPVTVDYFATSLPSMLLFRADLDGDRRADVDLLRAQVAALRGDLRSAREQLDAVLSARPDRVRALDLQRELEMTP